MDLHRRHLGLLGFGLSASQLAGPRAANAEAWQWFTERADGSLEIYFQSDPPGGEKDANWLPVPANQTFNVTVRNYWPKPEALDGSYKTPPIRRIG